MVAQLSLDYIRARPSILKDRLLSYLLFEGRPLTTRGRWINPLVINAWRLSFCLPLSAAPEKPVFILGQGRSGTTLLGRVLGLHPDLFFLNEPKALWHAATGQDDLIGSYSRKPGRYRMDAQDATDRTIRNVHRAYGTVRLLGRRKHVLDKYPEMLFRDQFLRAVLPSAKRIILVRDPWQVAGSIASWSGRNATPADDWWGRQDRKWHLLCKEVLSPDPQLAQLAGRLHKITHPPDRAALEWVGTTTAAIRVARADPANNLLVRFEDMTADPTAALTDIQSFCGLSVADGVIAYGLSAIRPPPEYSRPDLAPEIERLLEPLAAQLAAAIAEQERRT